MSITQRQRKLDRIYSTSRSYQHDHPTILQLRHETPRDLVARLATMVLGCEGGYRKPRLPSQD